jgi:periplasmic copper chaperone A
MLTMNYLMISLATLFLVACDAKVSNDSKKVAALPATEKMLEKPSTQDNQNQDKKNGVKISDNWIRATAPGQAVGAAYMTLTSPQDSKLVYVETAAAGSVEIHNMTMENGVMKMRMLDELTLKANQAEKLAPGGFHLMLFDLKQQLKAGESATIKLCFKDNKGNITHQDVVLPIKEAQ